MKEKTLTGRKEKAAQTREKIYTSAKQLFSEHSYETVSVDAIVKQAGVAKGSFYVHFESKDYLIATLINDSVKELDIDYKKYLESLSSDMPAYDVVLSLVSKIADVISGKIGCCNMGLMYKIQLTKEIKTTALIEYNRELYKLFYHVIDNGIKKNEFQSPFTAEELAKHFVAAYRGIAFEWCVRYPDFDLKEQALSHFKMLLTGVNSPSISNV